MPDITGCGPSRRISAMITGACALELDTRIKELVHAHVLTDFTKDERPWVEALCSTIAENAELLAKRQDASFQNKVHLAMQAKGFFPPSETISSDQQPSG